MWYAYDLTSRLALLRRLLSIPGARRQLVSVDLENSSRDTLSAYRAAQVIALADAQLAAAHLWGCREPRVHVIARRCLAALRFESGCDSLRRTLASDPEWTTLDAAELAQICSALVLVLLLELLRELTHRLAHHGEPRTAIACVLLSLDSVTRLDPAEVVLPLSSYEAALQPDPSDVYPALSWSTKVEYWRELDSIARQCATTAHAVASVVLALARVHSGRGSCPGRTHVGYFLVGEGRAEVLRILGRQAARLTSERVLVTMFAALLLAIAASLTLLALGHWPAVSDLLVVRCALFMVAVESAYKILRSAAIAVLPNRRVPRLAESSSKIDDVPLAICIPVLVSSIEHGREVVDALVRNAIMMKVDQSFAVLLVDLPDGQQPGPTAEELQLLDACAAAVEAANSRRHAAGHGPIMMCTRLRTYSKVQRCYIGRERKCGEVRELMLMMADRPCELDLLVGDKQLLRSCRYLIVLDEDSVLGRDAAPALLSAMLHPLNRARRIDDQISGYGVMVAARYIAPDTSYSPALTGPQGTHDTAVGGIQRDFFFDLFASRTFGGKGIFDVQFAADALRDLWPDDTVLSHDLVEGGSLRPGFVTDATVIENFPANHLSYCARLHRWTRGDWQNLCLLLARQMPRRDRGSPRKLQAVAKLNILLYPALALANLGFVVLVVTAVVLDTWQILASVFCVRYLPEAVTLSRLGATCVLHPVRFLRRKVLRAHIREAASREAYLLTFALHFGLVTLDAIARSSYRLIRRRALLEWTTARNIEKSGRNVSLVELHLWLSSFVAFVVATSSLVNGNWAWIIVTPWILAPFISSIGGHFAVGRRWRLWVRQSSAE